MYRLVSQQAQAIAAAGEWSLSSSELNITRCLAIASGSCWLAMDGVSDPVRMVAGDCV
jgi:hypothetical protein